MNQKVKVPSLDELNIYTKEDGHRRFLCCEYEGIVHTLRIPLHIWNDETSERKEALMKPFVQLLIKKISKYQVIKPYIKDLK